MPIRVDCPRCQSTFDVPDHLEGKTLRCRKCSTMFGVAVLPTPTRRTVTAPAVDEDVQPSGGGGTVYWVLGIAGGAALLLFLCGGGGVAAWLLFGGRPAATGAVVVAPPPQEVPPPRPPVDPGPGRPIDPPIIDPGPGNLRPPQPPPPPIPAVPWAVKVDAAEEAVKVPEDQKGVLPIGGFAHHVTFPATPSLFVAVSQKPATGGGDVREVWNVATMKKVGIVTKPSGLLDGHSALSPDGAYFAARSSAGGKTAVEVWATAAGRSTTLAVDAGFALVTDLEFTEPHHLLVARSSGQETVYQLWDVRNGQTVRQFKERVENDRKARAFSPGRKYLAVPERGCARVLVYDLTTGTLAGELPLPKEDFDFPQARGLVFSPDGKKLAGLFAVGPENRVQVWDVATGKLAASHRFEKDLRTVANNALGYGGAPLEWTPDGEGWLAYGQLLIDGQAGAVYFQIPSQGGESLPRRLFEPNRLALVQDVRGTKVFSLEPLPTAQIAAAKKLARAGKDPAAAELPPPKPADSSAVKEAPLARGGLDWKGKPDPAPAAKGRFPAQGVPLSVKGGDIVKVLFTSPEVGQAVVLATASPDALSNRRLLRAERVDLTTGRSTGSAELFAVEMPQGRRLTVEADLSPEGKLLVVRGQHDAGRVDAWSLETGKHLAGWRPAEKAPAAKVTWLAALDSGRALTLCDSGRLVLWSVPECKAVYSVTGVKDAPALGPGRTALVVSSGTTLEVLDPAKGERLGTLSGTPASFAVVCAAVRQDGKEYASVLREPEGRSTLVRFDLATGKAAGQMPIGLVSPEMEWDAGDVTLVGDTLYDWKLKVPLARYTLPGQGRRATGSPDGRRWFAVSVQPATPAVLAAQTLPDAATQALQKQLAAGAVQPVLLPGATVAVRVEGGPAAQGDQFRQRALATIKSRLETSGFRFAEGAGDVTLVVQFGAERPTGETRKYSFVDGGKPPVNVAVQEVACEAKLLDRAGAAVWQHKQSYRTPDPFGLLQTDDPDGYLRKMLWDNAAGFSGGLILPSTAVRTASGVEALPKSVTLSGDAK